MRAGGQPIGTGDRDYSALGLGGRTAAIKINQICGNRCRRLFSPRHGNPRLIQSSGEGRWWLRERLVRADRVLLSEQIEAGDSADKAGPGNDIFLVGGGESGLDLLTDGPCIYPELIAVEAGREYSHPAENAFICAVLSETGPNNHLARSDRRNLWNELVTVSGVIGNLGNSLGTAVQIESPCLNVPPILTYVECPGRPRGPKPSITSSQRGIGADFFIVVQPEFRR